MASKLTENSDLISDKLTELALELCRAESGDDTRDGAFMTLLTQVANTMGFGVIRYQITGNPAEHKHKCISRCS